MAKFPTYEEMGKNVAEKALDEFLYDGKSIREWMQNIASEDAISRQAVLSKIKEVCFSEEWEQFRVDNGSNGQRDFLINYIEQLSSVSSSEKPNKCEDAISRQMVLDATVNKNSIWNNITNAKGENLEKIILQLPSINQMNKWIGAEALDDIRAEIENKYESISDTFHHYETGFTDALEWALSIIDKYKEE